MKQTTVLFFSFLFSAFTLHGQVPTIQDCLGAIPVCQQIYVENLSPSGDGNYNNEINTFISCTAGELNSIWYTFTVDQTGDFGFVITPNDPDDDYDWALFNLTNATCADIADNPDLVVSCNAAGGIGCHGPTGATGATAFPIQGAGCNTFPPNEDLGFSPLNDLVPVQAGNTYVLMVSNWSGSPNGYTIDFGLGGDIGILDEEQPELSNVLTPSSCDEDIIEVEFNEFIQCATISEANFALTGPGGPYTITSISSDICDQGGQYENTFELTIDPPIASLGDFTLELIVSNPGEVLDNCDNPALATTFDFTVDVPMEIDVELGNDTAIVCVGQVLPLVPNIAQIVDFEWQDGSDAPVFVVDAPGIYSVTVTDACGSGSDTIEVSYITDVPTVDLGPNTVLCEDDSIFLDVTNDFSEYLWQDGSTDSTFLITEGGIYSVEVSNACGSVTDNLIVTGVPDISLDFGDNLELCEGDTLLLDATNEQGTYVWQDNSTLSTLPVTETGLYFVTVTTPCEVQSDTIGVSFIKEDGFSLGPDTILCFGDELLLEIPEYVDANYVWQNGTGLNTFNVTESGTYEVQVTTLCNIFEDSKVITYIPPIDSEIPIDTFLCEPQILLNGISNGFASYEWQDGEVSPIYLVNEPGTYTLRVYNQCEEVVQSIEVKECELCSVYYPNIFSPDFDGFNDIFLPVSDCVLNDFTLQIYDRWGGFLFESNDTSVGWDGTYKGQKVPLGVYVWRVEYFVIENNIPRRVSVSGDVTVAR
jgi:gliding motility-associated-like protein